MVATNWTIITPSRYEWERRALDFIRARFPTHDPYRAWANFEFQAADGAIYEVDLLVLTKQGFWLVEIKSRPGRVEGDTGTWIWTHNNRRFSDDNPVLLANRKAKALAALLGQQPACRKGHVPWLDALVFLSDPDIQCALRGPARHRVCLTDREANHPGGLRQGIRAALINREVPGVEASPRSPIDIRVARMLTQALEQAGIRPSQQARRVGDYVLGELLADGPGYQDWLAEHTSLAGVHCRVRQYLVAQAASEEDRQRIQRVAAHEFRLLQSLEHPGILAVRDYKQHAYGPALLFHYEAQAVRLDHFLTTRGDQLTFDLRLNLLRQLADAIRYAHSKRIIHRALSPQSILVLTADAATPSLKIFNWQVGVRSTGAAASGTTHVQELVETPALVYMAPEALLSPDQITEAADVFSLGAIAYHLFSGHVPAVNTLALAQALRTQKGLQLSAVIDGVGPCLEGLVHWSTHPDVLARVGSVADFLELLEDVEEELTAPESQTQVDPVNAKRGDRLEHGFVVERILGRGSTAVALLAQKDGEEYVLKVARDQDHNARLREEGEVLKKLRSEFIVGLHDVLDMHGRVVLVLDKAGDETLATRLRQEGRCSLDLLQRFGEDVLAAVDSLERSGIAHRDIKPDNIAVRVSRQRLQLVLFDFSLSRAPAEHIYVGTVPYLEPFLSCRQPPRWDQAAERYAAGVTLYEMATGVLPRWGDGKSDPALTDAELVLEAEQFEPPVREELAAFFQRALHRDPSQRFDNAEEMLRAWREVFHHGERQMVTTPAGQEVRLAVSVSEAQPDTLAAMLGLSTRAMHALDRVNVITVRELLAYPVGDLQFMRGVGHKTRREILATINTLREHFPNPLGTDDVASTQHDEGDVNTLSLDALRRRVVGSEVPGRAGKQLQMRLSLLGLYADDTTPLPSSGLRPAATWPSQVEVASYLQVPRGRLSQIMTAERQRWVRDRAVTALRHQIVQEVQAAGGVMIIDELCDALLATRTTALTEEPARRRLAGALVRAAYEAEQTLAEPHVCMRRAASTILIACTPDLAAYAERLGRLADQLAEEDPLPAPVRSFQRLYVEPQPESPPGCQPLTHERLLHLAAHASQKAAVSTRQELYPRGMSALRALRLGLGALTGLGLGTSDKDDNQLSPANVRQRIAARYPEAEPLPDPPLLDSLLQEVGLDLVWDEDAGVYRRPASQETTGSSMPQRHSTAASARRPTVTPYVAEARLFEERLQHAYRDGAFLVLSVRPSQLRRCEAELLHRFSLLRHSCDRLLLTQLHQQAVRLRIDWQVVREADGAPPGSRDWNNLLRLVSMVVPAVEAELLAAPQPVLLVHPGLLARYGQMVVLERLRDQVGRRGVCPGLWVLVAADEQSELPLLDGQAIPLLTPGQRARVPQAWLENAHRAAGEAERR